ncbi:MAG: SDR family oxidoreductase [Flavobacteriales bacterium]|nr:SDR family oxidoreductase [Flavobacteriales bacterium]
MKLNGAVALITGASSGIGKETARMLAAKGAKTIIVSRNAEKLDAVASAIGAMAIAADVAETSDVERIFRTVTEKFGRLDILINNAGIGLGWAELTEVSLESMQKVYSVNVFGAMMMGQGAARMFKQQRSGNIINIGSTASLKGYAKGTVYSSSKFALRGMTQCWQDELRPFNVRVTQMNPSEVTTAFGSADGMERAEKANRLRSTEIAHQICAMLEMDDRGFIPEVTVWATNPWD